MHIQDLYLLGAPAGIGFAHIGRGLDGGDELENGVGDTDDANDSTRDFRPDRLTEEDGADEDVDCERLASGFTRGIIIGGK